MTSPPPKSVVTTVIRRTSNVERNATPLGIPPRRSPRSPRRPSTVSLFQASLAAGVVRGMSRRPQRQRSHVQHYSDDNPSTFTVKRKRGDPMPKDPPKQYVQVTVGRSPGKQPSRPRSSLRASPPRRGRANEESKSTTRSEEDDERHSFQTSMHATVHETSASIRASASTSASATPGKVTKKETVQVDVVSRPKDTSLSHGVTLHPLWNPGLPSRATASATASVLTSTSTWQQQFPVLEDTLRHHPDPQKVPGMMHGEWMPARLTYESLAMPLEGSSNQTTASDHLALPYRATCLRTTRVGYTAVGDAAGYVSIYNQWHWPVMKYTTMASQRECKRRLTSRKTIAYPNSLLQVDLSQKYLVTLSEHELEIQTILYYTRSKKKEEAAGATDGQGDDQLSPGEKYGHNVCLLSNQWHSIESPLAAHSHFDIRRVHGATSVRAELNVDSSRVLVWGATMGNTDTRENDDMDECHMWVIHIPTKQTFALQNKLMSHVDIGQQSLVIDVIWDRDEPNQLLLVVQPPQGDARLLRYDTETSLVLQQENMPGVSFNKTNSSECRIHVFDNLDQVMICCHKGARCHDLKSLTFLAVYGEAVTLHGRAVYLHSCLLVDNPNYEPETIRMHKKHCYVFRSDELAIRDQQAEKTNTKLLLCMPHPTRGPTELRSTLYVYQLGDTSPMCTLQAPPGGLVGISNVCLQERWNLMCVTHEFGELLQMITSIKSDFAGIMYPVGYKVVEDNIEYIESEEELDIQILQVDDSVSDRGEALLHESSDTGRTEAKNGEEEDFVSVLAHSGGSYNDSCCIPAVPETNDNGDDDPLSPQSPLRSPKNSFIAGFDVTDLLPQAKNVLRRLKEIEEACQREDVDNDDDADVMKAKLKRGGRSIEQLLIQSIDPILRQRMIRLQQQWGDGMGTTTHHEGLTSKIDRTLNSTASSEDKEIALDLLLLSPNKASSTISGKLPKPVVQTVNGDICNSHSNTCDNASSDSGDWYPRRTRLKCLACEGRLVTHRCGLREHPVDYDAIERAERARREAEEADRQRIKIEKRKAADQKRREARKKMREEEERQRLSKSEHHPSVRLEQNEPMQSFHDGQSIPRYSDLSTAQFTDIGHHRSSKVVFEHRQSPVQGAAPASYNNSGQDHTIRFPYSNGVDETQTETTSPTTTDLDPNELKPSTALSSNDALAALAGLACAETDFSGIHSSRDTGCPSSTDTATAHNARHDAILASYRAQFNYERSNSGTSNSVDVARTMEVPLSLPVPAATPTHQNGETDKISSPSRMMSPMDLLAATAETTAQSTIATIELITDLTVTDPHEHEEA